MLFILVGMTVVCDALTAITNANIHSAVDLWCSDEASALATYGHISGWDTSSVTDMKELFYEKETFNDVRD